MTCVFCDIASGINTEHEILWQDDRHIAFLDKYPVAEGHVLVIPRKHVDYVFDMEDTDYEDLMRAAKHIAQPLRTATNKERIMLVYEGFSVPHVHAHLIPNSSDTDRITFNRIPNETFNTSSIAEKLRPHFV